MTKAPFKKAHKDTNNTETVAAPLTALELSPLNPRQNPDSQGLDALAASIKAVGLLQNLIGIKDGETIGIVAGGRRLQALKTLAANDDIPKSTSVLVRLAETEEQALQWAATENEAREDLSPADEVRAYHAMNEAGMKVADIAIANAKTVRHVKGRLRLAALSPVILDALERGEITLDAAAAFTITDNHDKQEETFNAINSHPWWRNDVQQIKSNLSADIPDQRDIRFAIVTRELYEERGGIVREDLFGEQIFFHDTALLDQLASERMEEIKADLISQGWKWADIHLARKPWDFAQDFDVIPPVQPDIAEGVEERMEELEGLMNEETITEEQLQEFDALEASIAPFYRDHHRQVSGVTVFIGHDHQLQFVEGLVREEDRADAIANGLIEIEDDEPTPTPKSNNSTPYSEALARDLSTIRTGAAQNAILANPAFAHDLAIFALCFPMYQGVSPVLLHNTFVKNKVEDHGQTLMDELERYPAQYMDHKEALMAFEQFMELS
ncbi:MAG: ParB/RepB/Spo0J family partition protein, partial [Pseudomonadota bacterium]